MDDFSRRLCVDGALLRKLAGLGFLKSGGMVCVVFLSFMMSLSAVFYCRLLRADSERSFANGVRRPAFERNVRKGKYEVVVGGCFDACG